MQSIPTEARTLDLLLVPGVIKPQPLALVLEDLGVITGWMWGWAGGGRGGSGLRQGMQIRWCAVPRHGV